MMTLSQFTRFSGVRAIAEETGGASNSAQAFGVDVSHWNGTIDWQSLAQSGVTFAFVKAFEGIHWPDPKFQANITGAHAAGILCGAYHVFTPNEDGRAQASCFCQAVRGHNLPLPLVLDLEGDTPTQHPDKDTYGPQALAWLEAVQDEFNQTPMVYANPSTWSTFLSSKFAEYPYWQAQYVDHPTPPAGAPEWTFWQYSQSGRLSGIDGDADLDRYQGSVADLRTRYGVS